MSLLRSWEIYRVTRSINIPRLRRSGIREFASSIRALSHSPLPIPYSQLQLFGYASIRCFDEIDQVINFRDAAHLGFDAFERLRRIEA
jgi:hypothetical protein